MVRSFRKRGLCEGKYLMVYLDQAIKVIKIVCYKVVLI